MTRRSGNGWYRLPSGITVHVQARRPLDPKAVEALDEVAVAAQRWMMIGKLRNALLEVAADKQHDEYMAAYLHDRDS
ncbi:MAG TPA: hypothetical protein VF821_16910 [Lentzea sp.]